MERDHQKNMERALVTALGEHRKNKWDTMEDICELICLLSVLVQSVFACCRFPSESRAVSGGLVLQHKPLCATISCIYCNNRD